MSTTALGADTAAAVIAEARRRQRRRRLVLTLVAAAAVAVGASVYRGLAVAPAPRVETTPGRATRCLRANGVLVSALGRARGDFHDAPARLVSLALVPGSRLVAATIYFESSAAEAEDVVGALVARLRRAAPTVDQSFTVRHNAVVFWESPRYTPAQQSRIVACL